MGRLWNPQLVIPSTFEQCFTYEKQILWLKKQIDDLKSENEDLKNRVAELEQK